MRARRRSVPVRPSENSGLCSEGGVRGIFCYRASDWTRRLVRHPRSESGLACSHNAPGAIRFSGFRPKPCVQPVVRCGVADAARCSTRSRGSPRTRAPSPPGESSPGESSLEMEARADEILHTPTPPSPPARPAEDEDLAAGTSTSRGCSSSRSSNPRGPTAARRRGSRDQPREPIAELPGRMPSRRGRPRCRPRNRARRLRRREPRLRQGRASPRRNPRRRRCHRRCRRRPRTAQRRTMARWNSHCRPAISTAFSSIPPSRALNTRGSRETRRRHARRRPPRARR